ncbi:hypothetical protein GYMLUDRAFT_69910 [Collybiopsis luxurians FD-317 M1]|nr:hypothetical protein GYMLUDRAFT_69910 [Collybiopsis luxurians FD-317 M1]
MENATSFPISPTIPFEFLPPTIASQSQIVTYILAGVSGIFVWDVLSNITADWYMFHLAKNRYALAAYVISRIGAMTYVIGRTVYTTYPVSNCKLADIILDCFFPIGTAGSCFLFFLRARATFIAQKYMVAFFAFLWVSVLASSITVPFATSSVNIGNTPYCVVISYKSFATSSIIVATVHDTLIFLAISYKLMSYGFAKHYSLRERILGTNLPAFSKGMLRNGQKYYLVTVLSNLATIAMAYAPVNPVYQLVLTIPNMMLTNVMACYVYRQTVLGQLRDPADTMDAHIIPTEQNTLPLAANSALAPDGRDHPSSMMNAIVIEMSSVSHRDDVDKFKPDASI